MREDGAAEPTGSSANPEKLVVGVGASAGGIKALREFFAQVPATGGIAYIVILHLSPDHDSKLAEVLQMTVPFPVMQVTQPVRIAPDRVYVIPPNKRLDIVEGMLTPSDFTRAEQRRSPVDLFFRALARGYDAKAVAVVLRERAPTARPASRTSRNPAAWSSRRIPRRPSTPTCRTTRSPPGSSISSCRWKRWQRGSSPITISPGGRRSSRRHTRETTRRRCATFSACSRRAPATTSRTTSRPHYCAGSSAGCR